MTTLVPFVPSQSAPFTFSPTLDGTVYTAIVTWNFWDLGGRWYVNLYDQSQTRVFTLPLIGSQAQTTASSMTWAAGVVTVTVPGTLPYSIGAIAPYTIANAVPSAYNGAFQCAITGPMTFTYALTDDPGLCTAPGAFSIDVSLTGGYFASTLVYRQSTGNFEINP